MKKLLVRLGISILIGGGMLYLAARHLDFGKTWSALEAARWWVLLPYFGLMAAQHFFRAWRWGYLLAPIEAVPFARLLPAASVGFAALLALPLRMGELVRPYMVAGPRLRMTQALGTLAVERVFDGLLLAATCFFAVTFAARRTTVPTWLMGAGLLALGLFLAVLVVLVLTLWQRERAVGLCRALFSRISPRLGDRLADIARGVVDGFQVLPDWRRMLSFAAASLAYWFLNGAAVWVLGVGFDIRLGLDASIFFMAIVGVGIMIPAGPGFIGNFELFAEGALALYTARSIVESRGAAYIVALHATNALWYVVTGGLALLSPQVTFHRLWAASRAEPPAQKMDSPVQAVDPGSGGAEPHAHDHLLAGRRDRPDGLAEAEPR
jgi:glycosyltransferase 2 family protein